MCWIESVESVAFMSDYSYVNLFPNALRYSV